jgi:DNA-binding CsgD family transcriptional regulator
MEARTAAESALADDLGLLEREAELGRLSGALDQAHAGRGSTILIDATDGLGKSRMLDAAARIGREKGLEVLSATGRELERDFTFGITLQLLETRVSAADAAQSARLLSGAARLAGPLLSHGARAALPDEGEAFSLLHGLYRLCVNLAEERPLVLVVDDAQWADPASLRFVLYLAHRLADQPVCLLLAADLGGYERERQDLAELAGHTAVETLALSPLSPQGVSAALRSTFGRKPDERFARECFRATRGSPLLVYALAQELALAGVEPTAANAGGVALATPEPIVRWIGLRLSRLDPGALALARAAAVLGDGAEPRHAALLAELDPHVAPGIADALSGAGVLRSAERLAFAEPLIRRVVEAGLTPAELAEAHLAAAQMLEGERALEERVASHLLRASCRGNEWVVESLARAAQGALERGEPDAAVTYLRRALEEPPARDRLAVLTRELGRAEALAGKPQAAGRLSEAMRLTDDPRERASTTLDTGRTLCTHGRFSDAADVFREGLVALDDRDGQLAMRLQAAHALALRLSGQEAPVEVTLSAEAVDAYAADSAAGRVLLARLAFERALRGEPNDGVRELARTALGRGALLDVETSDGLSYYLATTALVLTEDVQAAELALTAAVEEARTRGSRVGLATASGFRAWAILRRGRLAQAAADAEAALEARRNGGRVFVPAAHGVLADVLLERGELEDAARRLALADRGAARTEDALSTLVHRVGGARLELALGHPEEALPALEEAGRQLEGLGVLNPSAVPWRGWAAQAHAQLGDLERARELAEVEVGLARNVGAPGAIGRSLQMRASLEQGGGGVELLREAVEQLEGSQLALSRAHALVALGSVLRRSGKRRDAREPLRLGLDLAERCGATALVRRATEELGAAGARPRRTALTGAGALTPRERQVARLAAAGRSNREIAEDLVVTIKTVEWHLRQSFIKLGIGSRGELGETLASERPAE